MNLRDYLKALTTSDRDAFVRQCGITLGFLRKAISIGQPFSPQLCVAIEQATEERGDTSDIIDLETDGAATKSTEQAERAPAFDVSDATDMDAETAAAERAFEAEQKNKGAHS